MKKTLPLLFMLLSTLTSSNAFAQMTIMNVPSADVAEKKHIFMAHETQFRKKERGKFWNNTHYTTAGIGHHTELTATFFNLGNLGHNDEVLGTGFKSAIPLKIKNIEQYQPKLIIGSTALFSLREDGSGNWTYAAGSITIPQIDTRLTAGISTGTKQLFGHNVTAFMGGFEQRITHKLYLIGDWYGGKSNSMGVFATGLNYNFPHEFSFAFGYQRSNSKTIAQNAFIASLGKMF